MFTCATVPQEPPATCCARTYRMRAGKARSRVNGCGRRFAPSPRHRCVADRDERPVLKEERHLCSKAAAAYVKVLAISGSLRAGSSNTALLEAAVGFAPPGMEIVLFTGLGDLPHSDRSLIPVW